MLVPTLSDFVELVEQMETQGQFILGLDVLLYSPLAPFGWDTGQVQTSLSLVHYAF